MMTSRITSILADAFVLALTLKKALDSKRGAGRTTSMQSLSMLDFVVRHGDLYFSVALVMNLLGLFLAMLAEYPNGALIWISVLPSILMNRFILESRETYFKSPRDVDEILGIDTRGFSLTLESHETSSVLDLPRRTCPRCMDHHSMDVYCYSLRNMTPADLDIGL